MFPAKVNFIFASRIFALLYLILFPPLNVKSLSPINLNELRVFKEFLDYGFHKYGIIMHYNSFNTRKSDLSALFDKYYMLYYVISSDRQIDNIFDGKFSRAGIFMKFSDNISAYQHVLEKASEKGIFNNSNAWFFVGNENFVNVFKDLRIEANADVTLAVMNGKENYTLYDIFKTCTYENKSLNIEYKGEWSSTEDLTVLRKFRDSFVRRRRSFCNSTMKAGTALLEKPSNYTNMEFLENKKDFRHLDPMQRKTYTLMEMMEPLFNLSLEVVFSNAWGSPLTNGTWNGVIGDILSKKIEFSLCPMRYSTERARIIDFTPVLHTEHIRFALRHPRRVTMRNIFFQPLSPTVWWCILALSIYFSIQLAMHVRFEYRRQKLELLTHRKAPSLIEKRFDFVILQVLEVIFLQGPSPDLFRFLSTRTLIIAACVFSLMLQQFYSAFIVGSLLSTPSRTITTLEALYNSSLEIGMERIHYNFEMFINTSNPLVRNIYTKRICKNPEKNILSLEQGVERIGRGGFAFHVSLNRAYRVLIANLSESAFCDLQEIAVYPPVEAGLGAPKNSIYREYLAKSILLFRETGLLQYNEKQWATQLIDCSLVQGNEVEVDMKLFLPALVLLTFAMSISFIVFLMEIVWKWHGKQKEYIKNNKKIKKKNYSSNNQ